MRRILMILMCMITPAFAEVGDLLVDDGETNLEEQTLSYFAEKYDYKAGKSTACTFGYLAAKAGRFKEAQKIFDKCVEAGVDAAYPWQSLMAQSGLGKPSSLEEAAAWDRKSAERGYKVGQFNYGLDLLLGHGVPRDVSAGKALIDLSAAQGFSAAQEVVESGYDPSVAIPDADEKRVY